MLTPLIIVSDFLSPVLDFYSTSTHFAPLFATIGKRHLLVNIAIRHLAFCDKDLANTKPRKTREISGLQTKLQNSCQEMPTTSNATSKNGILLTGRMPLYREETQASFCFRISCT